MISGSLIGCLRQKDFWAKELYSACVQDAGGSSMLRRFRPRGALIKTSPNDACGMGDKTKPAVILVSSMQCTYQQNVNNLVPLPTSII